MRYPIPILVLFGWLCGSEALEALLPDRALHQYAHRQWRVEEGLPQNTVRAIAQTPDGMLWVGTQGGLARFDGFDFDLVDDPDAILDRHHAYAAVVDGEGDLWIGSNSGELLRRRHGRFERVDGVSTGQILVLRFDDDTLWLGTEDVGAVRMAPDGSVETWGAEHGIIGAVHDLAVDGHGGAYVPTAGSGLHHIDRRGRVRRVAAEALPSPLVWSVARDADGLWIGTTLGLARIEAGEVVGRFGAESLGEAWVRHVMIDSQGVLWIGTV
ncbi:MAG: two-component regulator propeller domain-containing protein, partial [Acidobacteriota bacterium]